MRRYDSRRMALLGAALGLAWLGAGCSRAQLDRGMRQIERSSKRVSAEVHEEMEEAVETARTGVERAKHKLPEATEHVRDELVELGHEAHLHWDAARDKWRHRHDRHAPHR